MSEQTTRLHGARVLDVTAEGAPQRLPWPAAAGVVLLASVALWGLIALTLSQLDVI